MFRIVIFFLVFILVSCEKKWSITKKTPIEYNFNVINNGVAIKKINYEIIDAPIIKAIEPNFLIGGEKPIVEFKFSINDNIFYILYILFDGNYRTSSICLSPIDLTSKYEQWQSLKDGNKTIYYNTTEDFANPIERSFYQVTLTNDYFFKNIKQIHFGGILKINAKYKIDGVLMNEEKIISKEDFELKDLKISEFSSNVFTSYFHLPIAIETIQGNLANNNVTHKDFVSIKINNHKFEIPINDLKEFKLADGDLYDKKTGCIDLPMPINDYCVSSGDFRLYQIKNQLLIFITGDTLLGYSLYSSNDFTCEYTSDGINFKSLKFKKKAR